MGQTDKKKSDRQKALANLGMYALERNELKAIMNRAIDVSCIALNLDCAVIFSLNVESNTLQIGAQAGCAQEKDPVDIEEKNFDITAALNQTTPLVVTKYEEEKRFPISPFMEEGDFVSSIHLVIRGTKDTYGVLGFYSNEHRAFDDEEINFLQILANMVGMAIERERLNNDRTRLNRELEQKNKQLTREMKRRRQYQREILTNSIIQRRELGSYLHENIAQILASAKITAHTLRSNGSGANEDLIHDLMDNIDSTIAGIQDLSHDIIPVDVEKEGLTYALGRLAQKTEKMYAVHCLLKTNEQMTGIDDLELATNVYLVAQEAIKNACVQSNADEVTIILTEDSSYLKLIIMDNGRGFSPSSREEEQQGVHIMNHRMEVLGGDFNISARASRGTKITCRLPL